MTDPNRSAPIASGNDIEISLPPPIAPPTSPAADAGISVVPPPFLVPAGAVQLYNLTIPPDWKLSKKLSKQCSVKEPDMASETKNLRELNIPIESLEIVVHACAKKDNDGDLMANAIENNSLSNLDIARKRHRSLILTRGSLQLKRLPFGIKNLLPERTPSVLVSIFDLRGMHVSPDSDAVIIAFQDINVGRDKKNVKQSLPGDVAMVRYAMYQTPYIKSFLGPLASALIAAYMGVPTWAIPFTWSGNNIPEIPPISQEEYTRWMGKDGGFSSSVYAAALTYHVKNKLIMGNLQEKTVMFAVSKQQPARSKPINTTKAPRVIDLVELAKTLSAGKPDGSIVWLVLAGLNALTFNLGFRQLKLSNFERKNTTGPPPKLFTSASKQDFPTAAFRNTLARMLLYNVTLRDVDFQSTDLGGFGQSLGGAWAMNAQPLISRINFSNCKLTGDDLRGLLHGLARIWCGGTALAESIRMANNPQIPTEIWDVFFRAFIHPSTLMTWPQNPPPPPNLSFLQELDIRGTCAVGPGLFQFAEKLTGLRTLKLASAGGTASKMLLSLPAPLETFEAEHADPECIEALFKHHKSLKEVTLNGFVGDAGPLLNNWPQAVPNLTIAIGSRHSKGGTWVYPSGAGYSPGTLLITNHLDFGVHAIAILAKGAPGLKKLVLHNMYYWELHHASTMLAVCGLETLHIHPPLGIGSRIGVQAGQTSREPFWKALATSKTLRNLQIPNQLMNIPSDEVAMIGHFLKANRSVQHIGFDNSLLVLKVDGVKALRSAFYGNKKVVSMQPLQKAEEATRQAFRKEIDIELEKVVAYKREIKAIFQRNYSKYNRNWRDVPNVQKLPWVERIRVSKRKIGRLEREQKKIATLLSEINACISQNKKSRAIIEEQKGNERLVRREGQLKQLSVKKQKFAKNLITKLHKAKLRGRQQKSAKMQVPRSTYYKSRNMWPSNKWSTQRQREHSQYRYYNDPYYARNGNYYPGDYNYGPVYPYYWMNDDDCNACSNQIWGGLISGVEEPSREPDDPWANLDAIIENVGNDYGSLTSPEYLAVIHEECSELGIDVVENISGTLDDGAAVADKLGELETSMGVPAQMLTDAVDSSQIDVRAIEDTLPEMPEYQAYDEFAGEVDAVDDGNTGEDDAMGADDAVTMYAGAGPRDLDDGGPSFGGSGNAALAGARRRAKARKSRRLMQRVRKSANERLPSGYKNLRIAQDHPKLEKLNETKSDWPDDLVHVWTGKVRTELIKAMSESNLFELPIASSESHLLLTEWSTSCNYRPYLSTGIEVTLVTQCSLDRLSNLEAQLALWAGKASVTIYLKFTESKNDAIHTILSTIERARNQAGKNADARSFFDVAVTVVEGYLDDEQYPINYLRNVALLEAQRQHLRMNASLESSAVLLVDVDFRPSFNLRKMLHSRNATESILKQRQVIVCPAFETAAEDCPQSIDRLNELVREGKAEGFHQSHFPQGHGPTQFETFWDKSLLLKTEGNAYDDCCWLESYKVQHEDLFEPYIVMASADAPLYDERFQGYGLNKVSHLATVAAQKDGEFFVLPGVFLVAPAHERSESWAKIYGKSQSEDHSFNQLMLKGLYYNFTQNLKAGGDPVVSESTRLKRQLLLEQQNELDQQDDESNIGANSIENAGVHVLCK